MGRCHSFRAGPLLVQLLVDFSDLCYPSMAFSVLQRQDFFVRPVKVIRNVRYLFIEPL